MYIFAALVLCMSSIIFVNDKYNTMEFLISLNISHMWLIGGLIRDAIKDKK